MKFIKQHSRIIFIIILSLLNIYNCLYLKKFPLKLNNDQISSIYSALAQIIGAMLGLIITCFSIADSKLKSTAESDNTISIFADTVRNKYYSSLKVDSY